MAAGLSLLKENVEELRRSLNEQAMLGPEDFIRKVWIDVPMPLEYISQPLIEELDLLEPFGQGNEKPLFAQKNLFIRSVRVLGKNRNAIKLSPCHRSGNAHGWNAVCRRRFLLKGAGREPYSGCHLLS